MTRQAFGPRDRGRDSDQLHEFGDRAVGGGRGDQQTGTDGENADGPRYQTGTTIVAIAAADAVVMAADRRMSLGGRFTANKRVEKIEQIHPTGALAISGTVGPAQSLLDQLRAETGLYEARRGDPMSVAALAKTAGHLVRGLPVAPLLGGVDDSGPQVYELDGSGSVLADQYAAGGSGMQVAYGVLERRFEPGVTTNEARETARAAVAAASERDTASGNGVTVATITSDGVRVTSDGEGADSDGDAGEGVA